jgi:hypothetical protein
MKIINTFTEEQLNELYNESALTWEGLSTSEDNLNAVMEWLEDHKAIIEGVEPIFHITTGRLMNKCYGLTGDNAYPNDLNIVSVTNINQMAIVLKRFEVGGRWFDDIVGNNARRENEQ